MIKMKLSKRLEMIASLVPKGSKIADIGTDHGYIPIYLIQEKIAVHGIAMDVRKGPLERAEAHIREAGLCGSIEVRLSNGLSKLLENEADCVIIAGMGGELMIHILEEGKRLWDTIPFWVLSPHSEPHKVRRFLDIHEFFIEKEIMLKEDGKYYPAFLVSKGTGKRMNYEKEIFYRYGKLLLEVKECVLMEYLKAEEKQLEEILKVLSQSGTEAAESRKQELKGALAGNKEAQNEMQ